MLIAAELDQLLTELISANRFTQASYAAWQAAAADGRPDAEVLRRVVVAELEDRFREKVRLPGPTDPPVISAGVEHMRRKHRPDELEPDWCVLCSWWDVQQQTVRRVAWPCGTGQLLAWLEEYPPLIATPWNPDQAEAS
jgi:hypothetical protein